MSEKIMIVLGAPRRAGNTAYIARQIAAGAREAGKEVALIPLSDLKGFGQGCTSCYACQRSEAFRCVLKDEVSPVLESIRNFDCVVLATPVYFFGASAQLKSFIDRFYSLVKYENEKLVTPLSKIKFALAVTAGDTRTGSGAETFHDAMKLLAGYIGAPEPEMFFVGGCGEAVSHLEQNHAAIAEAMEFGRNL